MNILFCSLLMLNKGIFANETNGLIDSLSRIVYISLSVHLANEILIKNASTIINFRVGLKF